MRKVLLFIVFCLPTIFLMAQQPKNLKIINSSEIILEGIDKFDNGEYQEAEKLFKSVPIGDSLFVNAQYELAYCYYAQQRYNEAIYLLEQILETPRDINKSMVYTQLGNTYSEINRFEKAIEMYDNALKMYPYNHQLHYNKGVVYQKMENYVQSEACFKMAILCNPLHQGSHLQLGISYLKQYYFIPGILAINFAVMINPQSDNAVRALQLLDALFVEGLANFNADEESTISSEVAEKNKKYKYLENLVKINFVLNEKYKLKTDLNHLIIRQNQLIFENIELNPNSFEIEDQIYVPIFKMIGANKKDFNVYSYLIFSGTNLEQGAVSEKSLKMEKKNKELYAKCLQIIDATIEKGVGVEPKEFENYTYYDYELTNFGSFDLDEKGQKRHHGKRTSLNDEGGIENAGYYDKGKGDGPWKLYDKGGQVIQEFNMVNGNIDGIGYVYFSDSEGERILSMEVPFIDGTINGTRREYNRSGNLIEESVWVDNLYDGECKTFYSQGNLKSKSEYKAGEIIGLSQDYYPNQMLESEIFYAPKDSVGFAKYYYPNGKLEREGLVKNNSSFGNWKYYFVSGKIGLEGEFDENGNTSGLWKEFNKNGVLIRETHYDNNLYEGEEIIYNNKGIKQLSRIYKNDIITEVTSYDINGGVREKYSPKNKTITYHLYRTTPENDEIETTYIYQISREKKSIVKRFYPSGQLMNETEYKDGQQDGIYKEYYEDGRLKMYQEYKDGKAHGLYLKYHPNDTIQEEGFFRNGEQEGAVYQYYMNGSIKNLFIIQKGDMEKMIMYYPNQKRYFEEIYKHGLPYIYNFYDNNEQIFAQDTFKNGNGHQYRYFLNGNVATSSQLSAGLMKDTCFWYLYDGRIQSYMMSYENDYSGRYVGYDDIDESIKIAETNFLLGNEEGPENIYYINGQLFLSNYYENGTLEGVQKKYYDNGNLQAEVPYMNGLREGIASFYAVDGQTVMYQLHYSKGQAIAYSYMQKNKQMSEIEPFKDKDPITFVAYYTNGTKSYEATFVGGVKNGKELYFYPNGKIFRERNHYYDLYHGVLKEWYENGQLKCVDNYYYDLLQGESKEYHKNGNLYREANYVENFLHGNAKQYFQNGQVQFDQEWFYDNRIK